MRSTRILTCLAVLGLLAGCGGAETGDGTTAQPEATTFTATTISAGSIAAGQAVPLPAGAAVLAVTGKIGRTNKGGTVVLDVATIERLGVRQIRTYEPWVKQTLDFRGVRLADLLAVVAPATGATKVHIVAHDDYSVDVTMEEARAGGVLLATRSGDGAALPVDAGGPTRIVFQTGSASAANPDQWIWSLKTIDVQ